MKDYWFLDLYIWLFWSYVLTYGWMLKGNSIVVLQRDWLHTVQQFKHPLSYFSKYWYISTIFSMRFPTENRMMNFYLENNFTYLDDTQFYKPPRPVLGFVFFNLSVLNRNVQMKWRIQPQCLKKMEGCDEMCIYIYILTTVGDLPRWPRDTLLSTNNWH
jgi:hypothetical protein